MRIQIPKQLPSFGHTVKSQLTVLLFVLSGLAIIVVAFIGIKAVLDSGAKAQDITSRAMQQRAEQLLVQTANATAEKNSLLFQNSQSNVTKTALYVENVFNNPGSFTTVWKFDDHVKKQASGQWWNPSTELSNILLGNFITQPAAELKKEVELLHNLDYLVPQVLKSDSNAVALYYIGKQGLSFYYPNIDLGSIIPADLNPTVLDFYQAGTPENNPERKAVWTAVYDDPAGNGLTISASHPVYTSTNAFRGVTSVDLSLNQIAKNVESYRPIEGSYAFLIDDAGRAIALPNQGYKDLLNRSPKKAEFGPDLSKVTGDLGAVLKQMRSGKQGFETVQANNTKETLYIAHAPLEQTPFSLAIVARENVMLAAVTDLRNQVKNSTTNVLWLQILPFAVLLLFVIWAVGLFYIRRITDPIAALTEKANEITQGKFSSKEIHIPANIDNEVTKLTAAFNKMTKELSSAYANLEHKVNEVGDAHAKDEAILNSIGDGMVVTDHNSQLLYVNAAAQHMLDLPTDKFTGAFVMPELFTEKEEPVDRDSHPATKALESHQKITSVVVVTDSKGNKTTLTITATPVIQQDKIIGVVQLIRDITKERQIDRMKTEFISVASHQLRTPLSAIKWFGEMLSEEENPAKAHEFVTTIRTSTDRMIELVNSLLNISRIESGRIVVNPEPTNVKELLSGIVNDLKPQIERREHTLTVKVDEKIDNINLDPRLISQVYLSLIGNAIKYTPAQGKISIIVEHKDKELISKISDSGYGIPKAEQTKMFNKFFRGSNIQKVETDGSGLGLYLVKSIVESSGGKVWFESEENKGTTFWFTLPYAGMQAKEGEALVT